MNIRENVQIILKELPPGVELAAATKTRASREILEAVQAGVRIIGENYVQEAARKILEIENLGPGTDIRWHFIGHLQKNKIKKAVEIFDMIETIDTINMAKEVNRRCGEIGKVMPVLIEINSGKEEQKFGVLPEKAEDLIKEISSLPSIKMMGLMTMGPYAGNPQDARPYFKVTRDLFNRIKTLNLPRVEMKYLSMGMTNSYKIALEEGANLVRIGTKIFGERKYIKK